MLTLSAVSFAQTPQFYNYNNGLTNNSFPLNQGAGKMVQLLVPPGNFTQPTPATAGNISKLYFLIAATYPLSSTYTDFKIMLKQIPDSLLTAGSFLTGGWDTVYKRASVTLSATGGTWLMITLDHPFNFNPAQSLAIQMEQCASTQATGYSLTFTGAPGNRRFYSVGGCPFVYSGVSTGLINVGFDVSAAPSTCSKIAGTWCPTNTYPSVPTASYFHCAAWVGDTMYVQQPTSAGVGATTIIRYTYGGAWTTGVPCLVGVTGASMSVSNGKLYLIGGGTASVTTGGTTVQEYNPASGTWTSKAPLPAALSAHGSVTWGDSVIFVVGGPYTGAATNLNVHYYRPASDTWGTITNSLPSGQGRRTFALSISGNKIIMSCGYNTAYLKSTYVGTIGSNASQITWTAGADAPVAVSRPAGTSYGNFAFVVGGDTNGTAVKNTKVFVYNVSGNAWITSILNCPNPSSNMMNAVTVKCINDTARIFQPGGYGTAAFTNFDVTGCGPILTGSSNISSELPLSYSLKQNYPNPFNPVTKINYTLPKSGFVTLKVYDMLGREVVNLINENKAAGNYSVDFNASNLTSGVYFYRLESNGFVDTKKMMLVK
jgi:hypothetical protein